MANRHRVPVLARGGGTSLAGQTVGHAIVMDFSKYMNQVLEVNQEELWARVQPGLVQDALNSHVAPMGMLFGPDTSTSNRATIGGMIGNNSAGAHSIVYGKTLDHVLELTVLLADGSEAVLSDLSADTVADRQAGARAWRAGYTSSFRRWWNPPAGSSRSVIPSSCGGSRATTWTSSPRTSRSTSHA